MDNISFGENLKLLRKKARMSRTRLANLIGYSEKSIEKWESGGSVPPVATVCRIAELFGVTVDSLLFPQSIEIQYLLGIDGGGTKTEFLLTDLEKKPIKRVLLGGSNPVDIGIEATLKILEDGINKVCEGINRRQISVFTGLAGAITGNNGAQISKFLNQFGFAAFANGGDTQNALEIALHGEDGIAVIAGTGVIAFVQKSGEHHRIGGWGYHIDSGGSGYNFGADALDSALKCVDGRGGSEMILRLAEQKLGKSVPDSIQRIYEEGKAYVASFAPIVFEAYLKNDRCAEEIIRRNCREIAQIIEAGYKILNNKDGRAVITGGLSCYKDILKRFLDEQLDRKYNIQFTTEPMVNGAVAIAERIKGEIKNA